MDRRDNLPVSEQECKTAFDATDTHRISLLQSLRSSNMPPYMPTGNTIFSDDGSALGFAHLLSYAFTGDEGFKIAFPDTVVQSLSVTGERLPGLYQDDDGAWQKVDPDTATPHQQRNYIRFLMLNVAKSIVQVFNRSQLQHMATIRPSAIHHAECLVKVATDVCDFYEPGYTRSLDLTPPIPAGVFAS